MSTGHLPNACKNLHVQLNIFQLPVQLPHGFRMPVDVSEQLRDAYSAESLVDYGQVQSAPVRLEIGTRVSIEYEGLPI